MPTFGKVSSPAKEAPGADGSGVNDNDTASSAMAAATASAMMFVTQQSQQQEEVESSNNSPTRNNATALTHNSPASMMNNSNAPLQQQQQTQHPPQPPPSQLPPSTFTRVDGKGLWRSWKRNFKNKLLALLDLIDNSLDAAIDTAAPTIDGGGGGGNGVGNNGGGGNNGGEDDSEDDDERDFLSNFIGRVHIYPDDIPQLPQQHEQQHGALSTNDNITSQSSSSSSSSAAANASSSKYFNSTSTNRTSPRRTNTTNTSPSPSSAAAARGNDVLNSLLLGEDEEEGAADDGGKNDNAEKLAQNWDGKTLGAVTSSSNGTTTTTATNPTTAAAHNSSSQTSKPNTNNTTTVASTPPNKKKPTGLVIINNCVKPIRPLTKVLEVYNSSKIDSGADHIGENGVGLKQGCATLSDLSFVLVKNGKEGFVELGMIAEQLQRPEGCYLPAFKFDIPHDKDDVHDDPSLNEANKLAIQDQMIELFSQPKHADSKWCIARYGDGTTRPNFELGMHRLIQHFDSILNFYKNPYVFAVVMDNMSYGKKHPTSFDNLGTQPAAADPIADLRAAIPKTYLHVPEKFDFRIGRQKNGREKVVFDYWPQRLVEMSSFKVKISQSVPWNHMNYNRDRNAYTLRVFVGFNRFRINSEEPKAASLYVYSRDAGRLIKYEPDARHLLGIGAGGSTYSSGLTILIDDISGNLPLSPTKQDVAFGEEAHGDIHKMNLFAWVGAITKFFYDYHFEEKFGKRKVPLTAAIKAFGSAPDQREMPPIDKSQFTTFNVKFAFWQNKFIRADKKKARENQGRDTYFKLVPPRQPTASRTFAPQHQPSASSNHMANGEDHISKKRKLDQMQAMNGQMLALQSDAQQRLDHQQQQQAQQQQQQQQQQMIRHQQHQQQQQRMIHQQQQRIQQQQHPQQIRHTQQQQHQLMAIPTTLSSLNNNNRQQMNGHHQTAHSQQVPEYLQILRAPVGASSQQQNGQHHPHPHHQSQRQPQQQPQQQQTENRPGVILQPLETLSNPTASKVASNAQSKKTDIEIVDLCDEDDDEPSKKEVPANGSNGKAPLVKKETTDTNNATETAAVNGGNEEDDNDDTSVASTKDYYKSLCERMAIQLEKRKDADHQRKKENKRLKQEVQELKMEVERQKKLLAEDQQI